MREQPLRSRHNRPTKDHPVGALKDLLVDLKALPADRVGHLGGLADLLAGPEVHPAKKKHRLENHEFSFLEGGKEEV